MELAVIGTQFESAAATIADEELRQALVEVEM
jgi:hypothetical protein